MIYSDLLRGVILEKSKGQNLLQGASILAASTIIVKLIGAVFKIPLGNILNGDAMGYFSTAYSVFYHGVCDLYRRASGRHRENRSRTGCPRPLSGYQKAAATLFKIIYHIRRGRYCFADAVQRNLCQGS